MEKRKYGQMVERIKELLSQNKAVYFGCHTTDFFNFVGNAIQLSGYFCHVLKVIYIADNGDVMTIEADGKRVAWHKFSEYESRIKSDKEILTLAYINTTPEQLKKIDVEMRSQVGHYYDMAQNFWHAFTTIVSWLGVDFFKGLGATLSGKLDDINPLNDPKKFNCAESCSRGIRAGGYSFRQNQDVGAITPSEFMSTTPPLVIDSQTTQE